MRPPPLSRLVTRRVDKSRARQRRECVKKKRDNATPLFPPLPSAFLHRITDRGGGTIIEEESDRYRGCFEGGERRGGKMKRVELALPSTYF